MEATKSMVLFPKEECAEAAKYSTMCTKSLGSSVEEEQVDARK
jgi:hypothetical protein